MPHLAATPPNSVEAVGRRELLGRGGPFAQRSSKISQRRCLGVALLGSAGKHTAVMLSSALVAARSVTPQSKIRHSAGPKPCWLKPKFVGSSMSSQAPCPAGLYGCPRECITRPQSASAVSPEKRK